jgi:hypothetical protein
MTKKAKPGGISGANGRKPIETTRAIINEKVGLKKTEETRVTIAIIPMEIET